MKKIALPVVVILVVVIVSLVSIFRTEREITNLDPSVFFGESFETSDFNSSDWLKQVAVESYGGSYRIITGYVSSRVIDQWALNKGYTLKGSASNQEVDRYLEYVRDVVDIAEEDLYDDNETIVEPLGNNEYMVLIYSEDTDALLIYISEVDR